MSLTDAIDHEIVMHRDAHFGGSFEEMLSYYQNEDNLGVQPEFDYDRIQFLAESEKQLGINLSTYLLYDEEREKVQKAKQAYRDLKLIYEIEKENNLFPKLIADLILTEQETPKEEIEKIVSHQRKAIPHLLALLTWEESYDPLFPGYGYAPNFALQALSKIKDASIITPVFEMLGKETVFGEGEILTALLAQGEEAKQFLLKIIESRPISKDNTHAAFALSIFPFDAEIQSIALQQIESADVWKHPSFFIYLLFLCEGKQEALMKLMKNPLLPQNLKKEIEESMKR